MLPSKLLLASLCLLTFGAGFGLAHLLQDPAHELPDHRRPEGATERSESPRGAPSAPVPSAPQPEPIATSGDFRALLRQSVAALPREERERGEGVIQGRVREIDGGPLPGVRVKLVSTDVPEFKESDDLAGDLATWALERRWRDAHTYETVTDAEGQYRLEGLPDHRFELSMEAMGWRIHRSHSHGDHSIARPPAEVHALATAAIQVPFEVVDQDGRPLTQATIYARFEGDRGQPTTTDFAFNQDQRSHWFTPSRYTFWASQKDQSIDEMYAQTVAATISKQSKPTPIRLTASPTGTVRVHVALGDQPLHPDALMFRWAKIPEGVEPSMELFDSDDPWASRHRGWHSSTIEGIPYGSAMIGVATRDSGALLAWRTVEVRQPMTDIHWPIEPLPGVSTFQIIARGPEGQPADSLKFSCFLDSEAEAHHRGVSILYENSGHYTCSIQGESDDSVREMGVRAEHSVFGVGTARSAWPPTAPLVLTFTPYATLSLHIVGMANLDKDLTVQFDLSNVIEAVAHIPDGLTRDLSLSNIDSEGRAEVPRIIPGTYELRMAISESEGRTHHNIQPLGRITVVPGTNTATIPFPALGRLTVEIKTQESQFTSLQLLRASDKSPVGWAHTGWDGEGKPPSIVDFGLISNGQYLVLQEGRGTYSMKVDVQGTTRVVWDPPAPDAIRITITEAEGSLAAAGFADGDLIVGVASEDITAERFDEQMARLFFSSAPIAVRIERGGRTIEMTVDFKLIRNSMGSSGGELQPTKR